MDIRERRRELLKMEDFWGIRILIIRERDVMQYKLTGLHGRMKPKTRVL